jgi:hypothetical protein
MKNTHPVDVPMSEHRMIERDLAAVFVEDELIVSARVKEDKSRLLSSMSTQALPMSTQPKC